MTWRHHPFIQSQSPYGNFVFRGNSLKVTSFSQMMMMPPMELLMEMSKAETVEEFMKYVDMSSIDPRDSLGT